MNRHSFFNRAAGAIVLLMLSSAAPVNAQGLLYTVNSTGDGGNAGSSSVCNDGTGRCTLRAALEAANAHAGTDGIRFSIPVSDPGYNGLFWTINLTRVLPDVSDSVSIIGPGANLLTVRRGAGGEYRIFNVTTTGTVTFSKLTINSGLPGSGTFAGGGIQNLLGGTVNVTSCTLSGNHALLGGGINNNSTGSVNVTNSTLSGNGAGDDGGGIANLSTGTVNVTNSIIDDNSTSSNRSGGGIRNTGIVNVIGSTVSNNSSGSCGGIENSGGTVNLTNSTISNNSAALSDGVGGILNFSGTVNVTNCTISSNSAPGVGGIRNSGFTVVKSSIIALNTGTDVSGFFTSGGFNLIGKTDGSGGFTKATDQTGTVGSPLNPKLDPNGLQDNGGPTKTIALHSDSPAIDKGTSIGLSVPLATDQRGAAFPRTFDYRSPANATEGDGTDIGAFELMLKMDSIAKLPNGHILLQGAGIPNRRHTIQASGNSGLNSFTAIGTPTADETGALQFDDAAALILEKRFYRLAFP